MRGRETLLPGWVLLSTITLGRPPSTTTWLPGYVRRLPQEVFRLCFAFLNMFMFQLVLIGLSLQHVTASLMFLSPG